MRPDPDRESRLKKSLSRIWEAHHPAGTAKPKENKLMKTLKEKAAAAPTPRLTKSALIVKLLKENSTARLADVELAKKINSAFPDTKEYNAKDVRSLRAKYNRGGSWGMPTHTSPLSVCYDNAEKK